MIREKKLLKSDVVLLEIAISNIIANAIKYVNVNGQVEIILSEKDEKLSIEIIDNGIGIPKGEVNEYLINSTGLQTLINQNTTEAA